MSIVHYDFNINMKTEEEARDAFYNLINDDPDFQAQWGYGEDAFYEWCSVYDDTKHIKKGCS